MAKLGYFVYCEDCQMLERSDGVVVPSLIEPLMVINLPFTPTTYSISFAVGIKLDASEGSNTKVKIELLDSTGKKVFSTGDIKPQSNGGKVEESKFIQIAGGIKNVLMEEAGMYITEIYIDGEIMEKVEIEVRVK